MIESLAATASRVIETDSIETEREELIAELQQSISKIRQLSELLPICARALYPGYFDEEQCRLHPHPSSQESVTGCILR